MAQTGHRDRGTFQIYAQKVNRRQLATAAHTLVRK
jgi:hypothetical protein